MLSYSFYKASINLIAKPDKGIIKIENYKPISPMNVGYSSVMNITDIMDV